MWRLANKTRRIGNIPIVKSVRQPKLERKRMLKPAASARPTGKVEDAQLVTRPRTLLGMNSETSVFDTGIRPPNPKLAMKRKAPSDVMSQLRAVRPVNTENTMI